jgi:MraZ protein
VEFAGYSGQAFSLAGDKSRYVLPPPFRKAVIESSDGSTLCIAKHDRWKCLVGFGLSRRQELEAQLDREEDRALARGRDFDRETRSSQLNGFVELPFDKSGRFVMPDYLRELGDIEGQLFFQGGGRFFTIWNPVRLQEMGDDWAAAKAACQALLADAQAKLK